MRLRRDPCPQTPPPGNFEVDPVDGLRMQKIAEELIALPASVKARARPLIE